YGNPGPDKMKETLCKSVKECPSAGMGAGIIDIAALMSASGAADPAFDSRRGKRTGRKGCKWLKIR
ncbi:MAG: hypothetical protein IKO39_12470, partial [Treponema sp.]|nr:hypothetical protein [Treponema sp.]